MRWTHLHPIATPDWFGTKLRNRAGELNQRIERILEQRQSIEAGIANTAGADLAEVDLINTVEFASFRVTALELLQEELKLRRDLAPFWGEYAKARSQAASKAADDHRKVEAEIVEGLKTLGFPVTIETGRAPWLPGVIASHPRVRAARERAQGLGSADTERRRSNEEAIRRLEEELATAVKRGLPA